MARDTLYSQFGENYPFWQKIKVSHKTNPEAEVEPIPPIILNCSQQIQHQLEQGSTCICLIVPNKQDFAFWLTLLLAFPMLRKYFDPKLASKYPYEKNELCLYQNKFIVQIERIEDQYFHISSVKLPKTVGRKSKNGPITIGLLKKNALHLQPIEGKELRLSEFNDVVDAKTSPTPPLIDEFLGIKSYGNALCFNSRAVLISNKGASLSSISSHLINGMPINELIEWQYVDGRWHVPQNKAYQKKGGPNIYVSRSFPNCQYLLDDNAETIKLIVVDGANKIIQSLDAVQEIIRKRIPLICISDPRDQDYFMDLRQRGFQFRQPILDPIPSLIGDNKIPSFQSINGFIARYLNKTYDIINCRSSQIESIYHHYIQIKKHLKDRDKNDPITQLSYKVYHILKSISQLIHIPDISQSSEIENQLVDIQAFLKANKYAISEDYESQIRAIVSEVKAFLINNGIQNSKFHDFEKLLQTVSDQSICILTQTDSSSLLMYWKNLLKQRKILFKTYKEYKQTDNERFDQLWILGFNSKKKLREYMFSCNATKLVFFLYPFEAKFFNRSIKNWWRNCHDSFITPQGELPRSTKLNGSSSPKSKRTIINTTKDGIRFDAKKKYSNDSNSVLFKIYLSGEYHLVCSSSHHLYNITELVKTCKISPIPRVQSSQLHIDDYLLFRATGADIIREWVDKELSKEGKLQLRQISEAWKKLLNNFIETKLIEGLNQRSIYRLFRKHGLKRSQTAFINWLDPERIGPQKVEDIDLIIQLAGQKDLGYEIEAVKDAIREVRGRHRKAWIEINKVLAQDLFPHLSNLNEQPQVDDVLGPFSLDRVGDVIILKILKIEELKEIAPSTQLSRLIPKSQQIELDFQSNYHELGQLFSFEDRLLEKLDSLLILTKTT